MREEDAMRELVLKMSMSLDGFVGGAGGAIDWIFATQDDAATGWTVETVWNASLHIMGASTFRDMAAFWPTSTSVFAAPMNQIPKAVFSRRGPAILSAGETTAALEDATRDAGPDQPTVRQPGAESWAEAYVASGDLADEVARLKAGQGKPIVAHGGASFARALVAAGLVDQYALLVHPVALGRGLPLFSELAEPRRLELVSTTAFPKGAAAQVYRPA
jgi:dihydrofolate reductase